MLVLRDWSGIYIFLASMLHGLCKYLGSLDFSILNRHHTTLSISPGSQKWIYGVQKWIYGEVNPHQKPIMPDVNAPKMKLVICTVLLRSSLQTKRLQWHLLLTCHNMSKLSISKAHKSNPDFMASQLVNLMYPPEKSGLIRPYEGKPMLK